MIERLTSNAQVIETAEKYLYGNHIRTPISIARGEGVYVWDLDGKKYLDFVGGIAVNGLGHKHPAVVKALQERTDTILHCCNYFYNESAVLLAKLICENSCFEKVLFSNSGAEANEALIKLARKYQKDHGHPERYFILSMENSFHGRTLATCAATGQTKVQVGFEPMPDGFKYAKFNDLEDCREKCTDNVAAILVEPIQGEGGVVPATKEFLEGLRALCDEKGVLLFFDEVQVGCGRTGRLFAYQEYGVEPDALSMAKELGSGVPIGGIATRGECNNVLVPGTHGSTYAGGPLATSVALATLDAMLNDGILDHCREAGEYFRMRLNELKEKHSGVVDVRGVGMINGLVLKRDGHAIVDKLFEEGILINCTAVSVLRFIPPLITSKEEIDIVVDAVDRALTSCGYDE